VSPNQTDIYSPDVYADGVPHERFDRLRREAPVFWHDEPGGPGFWAITTHRDVLDVLKDATTFSSEAGGTQVPDLPPEDIRRSPDNLAVMDPPRHNTYRALIGQSFTPRGLAVIETYVRQLVSELLDQAAERRTFDFAADFASKLPMAIILRMVGVPAEDQTKLNDWVLRLLATDDAEYATTEAERADIGRRYWD
jgi:cytochrome P450